MAGRELPHLRDGRVLLRGWVLDDAEALRPACGDPDICRFTTVPLSYTVTAAGAWIRRQQAHAHAGTAAVLAVIPARHERPVGMVGLFGLDDLEREARFGYWIISDWRGRGLASAATVLVAGWGFTTLDRSAIHIDREPANHASARVAERLGAVVSGARRVVHDGTEVELIRHTLTRRQAP